MKLSIVIPVYNEASTIQTVIDRVLASPVSCDREVIVVNDGSNDGTASSLSAVTDPRVRIFTHHKNRGKGAALITGFGQVTGDIVLIQDADLEYNPDEHPDLIAPIIRNEADVVFGSRFSYAKTHRVLYFWHMVGNRIITLCTNIVVNQTFSDVETCFKAFRAHYLSLLDLRENRFGIEIEISIKLARLRAIIYEIGISYHGRNYSQGKKIRWTDGVAALMCIVKYGLLFRHRRSAVPRKGEQ